MLEVGRGKPYIEEPTRIARWQRTARNFALLGTLGMNPIKDESIPDSHPGKFDVIALDDDAFREVENGEFSEEERRLRTETLEHGEVIFHDIGLDFYEVVPGDTVASIKEKLTKYPQYSYLKKQNRRLVSFNIDDKDLLDAREIPIPQKNAERIISDEDFSEYARRAIHEMKLNPEYRDGINHILKIISEKDLIASLAAIAKQESGKEHIGDFEQHLYQPTHHAFSYSYFHILDEGEGLEARQKLQLTRGQTYNPVNAAKLCLAFLIEKSGNSDAKLRSILPLEKHADEFASFYNGQDWKTANPLYASNIIDYQADAREKLMHTRPSPP